MTEIIFSEARHFRATPGVKFDDVTVPGSNGLDLVEHTGPSVSPPDRDNRPQWYVHLHQVDNNRVIHGHRLFELFNPRWVDKHWFVFLTEESGALRIPAGCFHRSYSGKSGSLLLNHAIRDDEYDETKEFHPCHCPMADEVDPIYHGISFRNAENFIRNGELLAP